MGAGKLSGEEAVEGGAGAGDAQWGGSLGEGAGTEDGGKADEVGSAEGGSGNDGLFQDHESRGGTCLGGLDPGRSGRKAKELVVLPYSHGTLRGRMEELRDGCA